MSLSSTSDVGTADGALVETLTLLVAKGGCKEDAQSAIDLTFINREASDTHLIN